MRKLLFPIPYSILFLFFYFCNIENPQTKNNRRNFLVFSYFANDPRIITTQVGNMNRAHTDPKAILLDNEKLLVVGNGAELFDPTTLSFSVIANRTTNRVRHALVRLQDGKILIVGGNLSTVELYDSTALSFTNTGSMAQSFRSGHTVTLLSNGRVLVTGGYTTSAPTTSFITAELYNPTTGLFASAGNMNFARRAHNATLLSDGTVLIVGGIDSQSKKVTTAEIYNPNTGLFTTVTNSSCQSSSNNTSVLLTNKNVFIADNVSPSSLQVFDVTTNNCSIIQQSLRGIELFSIAQLKDGRVLVVGGQTTNYYARELNAYDPTSNTFNYLGNMNKAKSSTVTVVLKDGRVLITGGAPTESLNFAEIYTP